MNESKYWIIRKYFQSSKKQVKSKGSGWSWRQMSLGNGYPESLFLSWCDTWKVISLGELYFTTLEVRNPFYFFAYTSAWLDVNLYSWAQIWKSLRYFVCWFPGDDQNSVFLESSIPAAFQAPSTSVYFLKCMSNIKTSSERFFFLSRWVSVRIYNCFSHNIV